MTPGARCLAHLERRSPDAPPEAVELVEILEEPRTLETTIPRPGSRPEVITWPVVLVRVVATGEEFDVDVGRLEGAPARRGRGRRPKARATDLPG